MGMGRTCEISESSPLLSEANPAIHRLAQFRLRKTEVPCLSFKTGPGPHQALETPFHFQFGFAGDVFV